MKCMLCFAGDTDVLLRYRFADSGSKLGCDSTISTLREMELSTPTRISSTIEDNQIPQSNMRIRKKNLKVHVIFMEKSVIISRIVHCLRRVKKRVNTRSLASL